MQEPRERKEEESGRRVPVRRDKECASPATRASCPEATLSVTKERKTLFCVHKKKHWTVIHLFVEMACKLLDET